MRSNQSQKIRPSFNLQKEKYLLYSGFCCASRPQSKSEERQKKCDLDGELKVTVMPAIFGALGMVPKNLEKNLGELEIKRRIKTIQTTVLLKLA